MGDVKLDSRVEEVIHSLTEYDTLDNAFCDMIDESEEEANAKLQHQRNCVGQLFTSLNEEGVLSAAKLYAEHVFKQENGLKAEILLEHLEYMVSNNLISPKPVCEALLNSNNLVYSNAGVWCGIFKLVRKIIGGVDYKSCRDVLRVILEKWSRIIPVADSSSSSPQIKVLLEVVSYILDRNACLLPSYFAINEIMKLSTQSYEDKQNVHWEFWKMIAEFSQSFRPTAQIVTMSGWSHLRPVIGHSNLSSYLWRLDLRSFKPSQNGPLPYDKDKPHTGLIRYALSHSYSSDFLTTILMQSSNRKQEGRRYMCGELEEQIIEYILNLLETQSETDDCAGLLMKLRSACAQLIFFVLAQMVSFASVMVSLPKKIDVKKFKKKCARDHLMWILMQFLLGVARNVGLYEYHGFLKLFDLLYPDKEELLLPNFNSPHAVHSMAVSIIFSFMRKPRVTDMHSRTRPLPANLKKHLEFLREYLGTQGLNPHSDFRFAILCNAYSTSENEQKGLMGQLHEVLQRSQGTLPTTTTLPNQVVCYLPTEPISIATLDALTVHNKMLLIQHMFGKIEAQMQSQTSVALSPALVESCARLMLYTEIEQTCGIKALLNNLMPAVFQAKHLPTIHMLLEMATYRLNHIKPHYRMRILNFLLDNMSSVHHNQLYVRYENTAACLLLGLGNAEVQQQVYRSIQEGKFSMVSNNSEELNRILVLTLARTLNVVSENQGPWWSGLLKKIFEHTPHNWSSHTLAYFPPLLQEFFSQNHQPNEDKTSLQRNVEADFNRWKSNLNVNENDNIHHFSRQGTERPFFLCVLWKCILMENRALHHAAYKIMEAIGPRALSVHLRTFADYFSSYVEQCLNKENYFKAYEAVNTMCWTYNIFSLDRFLLCLSLRTFEGIKDAQVCLVAIQLMVTETRFLTLVKEFTSTTTPEHWKTSMAYKQHAAYHQKHPEYFFYEGILSRNNLPSLTGNNPNTQYLPCYYDNICMRMLSVLDIVIHRLIELINLSPNCKQNLFIILENLCVLYKFHDRPITYTYNTLHYYYKSLVDKQDIKTKLILSIIGAGESNLEAVSMSQEYCSYLAGNGSWLPSAQYFYDRVGHIVNVMSDDDDTLTSSSVDYRFAEFTSEPAQALYTTCVELLSLPMDGVDVGNALLDVVFKWWHVIPRAKVISWMNAVALLVTALPEPFWSVLFKRLVNEFLTCDYLVDAMTPNSNPFEVFNFAKSMGSMKEQHCTYVLAVAHTIWYHSSIGQLSIIPQFIREQLKPIIKTEVQFLYLCHLVGPFFQRFQHERSRCCVELTIDLYEILERVDKTGAELPHMDTITDFFYHIKYMFVGKEPNAEVEKVIKNLRTSLQLRLRFITHHTTNEGAPTPTN